MSQGSSISWEEINKMITVVISVNSRITIKEIKHV